MSRFLAVAVVAVFLMGAEMAVADSGWTWFTPDNGVVGPPPEFKGNAPDKGELPPMEEEDDSWKVALLESVPGPAGPPGPKGDKGDKGDRGDKGDSADLCANIDGVQTAPGWKRWPQRYWGFKPRLERRVLALNRKGQIVCVTLGWVKKHGWRGRK